MKDGWERKIQQKFLAVGDKGKRTLGRSRHGRKYNIYEKFWE
jgi:hypothetical protein